MGRIWTLVIFRIYLIICLFPDYSAAWTGWARWFSPGGGWTTPAPRAPATWPPAAWWCRPTRGSPSCPPPPPPASSSPWSSLRMRVRIGKQIVDIDETISRSICVWGVQQPPCSHGSLVKTNRSHHWINQRILSNTLMLYKSCQVNRRVVRKCITAEAPSSWSAKAIEKH